MSRSSCLEKLAKVNDYVHLSVEECDCDVLKKNAIKKKAAQGAKRCATLKVLSQIELGRYAMLSAQPFLVVHAGCSGWSANSLCTQPCAQPKFHSPHKSIKK